MPDWLPLYCYWLDIPIVFSLSYLLLTTSVWIGRVNDCGLISVPVVPAKTGGEKSIGAEKKKN